MAVREDRLGVFNKNSLTTIGSQEQQHSSVERSPLH